MEPNDNGLKEKEGFTDCFEQLAELFPDYDSNMSFAYRTDESHDPAYDSPSLNPEQRLQLAVLKRALIDVSGIERENNAEDMRAARDWFMAESEDHFAFLGICDSLDIEPGAFKKFALTATKKVSRQVKTVSTRG